MLTDSHAIVIVKIKNIRAPSLAFTSLRHSRAALLAGPPTDQLQRNQTPFIFLDSEATPIPIGQTVPTKFGAGSCFLAVRLLGEMPIFTLGARGLNASGESYGV